ncbi:MAG TPA: BON domain-containing protein [Candidatus Competibacteraceae bacterium]|nr:BON domain-containing protein [Candidatus Competibacteraceae bacterium]
MNHRKLALVTAIACSLPLAGTALAAAPAERAPIVPPQILAEHQQAYQTLSSRLQLAEGPAAAPEQQKRSVGTVLEDASITAAVKSKLLWNRPGESFDISVTTRNGVVTLGGEVSSEEARTFAEQVARETDGVVSVENRILVVAPQPSLEEQAQTTPTPQAPAAGKAADSADDAWIAATVKAELMSAPQLANSAIQVRSKNGVVTLSGSVDSAQAKAVAVSLAEGVRGVKQVQADGLSVRSGKDAAPTTTPG